MLQQCGFAYPVTANESARRHNFPDPALFVTQGGVVGKSAQVTEEMAMRKDATERVETMRNNVRREDVGIERIPAAPPVARP